MQLKRPTSKQGSIADDEKQLPEQHDEQLPEQPPPVVVPDVVEPVVHDVVLPADDRQTRMMKLARLYGFNS